jgi:hypothetical protein
MKIDFNNIKVGDIIVAQCKKYSDGTGPIYVFFVKGIYNDKVFSEVGMFGYHDYTFYKLTDDYITISSNTNVMCQP